jgi:hypothetical protein
VYTNDEIVFNSSNIFYFQVVEDFWEIELENMPPTYDKIEFSTDAQYLYEMAHAISNRAVSQALADRKPGPMAHSRWLTTACRILRLYVTMCDPPSSLRILATYVMKVYVPMYFNIKCFSSVIYGSPLLGKFICWTQYLEPRVRNVVHNTITTNSYFAHSENILLGMLFDDRKEMRTLAIQKILHYRDVVEDPIALRVYKKPTINFNCTDYTEMIDLNDDANLFEPPFTRNIPYEHLEQYLEYGDPPLIDPEIPSHIQATERHVQLLAGTSRRVLEGNREGVMAVTLESRAKQPRLESKKDLQE